jgi:hypothetical protein
MDATLRMIYEELLQRPVQMNVNRKNAGRSQTFGVCVKRVGVPDYSRWCWRRPYLYKLLLEYGQQNIKHDWNSITVNMNYKCEPHKDKNSVGLSTIVGFGEYMGGELYVHHDDHIEIVNINNNLFTRDFSKLTHSTADFQGTRITLVYSKCKTKTDLPEPSVQFIDNKYRFFRGEELCTGMDHPLKQ